VTEVQMDTKGYEAPAIVVVGPVEELTLGGGGSSPNDANATYLGPSA
jgi:hypothetical protein